MRNKRGITLIALVITIIILLILAGITITQLTESGLFEKVQLAKEKSEQAQEYENKILSEYQNKIDSYLNNTREENDDCNHISTIIDNFTPEIKEVNGTYITIKIPDNISQKAKGYIYLLNDKVSTVSIETEYSYMNLNINTDYKISVISIDENGKIKQSSIVNQATIDKLYLYKEGNEYIPVTGGWVLSNYQANGRSQKNKDNIQLYYSIVGTSGSRCSTNNIIDASNFSSIYIRYTKSKSNNDINYSIISMNFGKYMASSKYTNGDYEEKYTIDSSSNNKLTIENCDSYDYIYEVYLTNE